MNIYISVVDSEFKYYYSHVYSRETKIYGCLLTLTKPVGNQAEKKLRDGVGGSVETLSQQSSATAEGHCSLGPVKGPGKIRGGR